MPKKVKIKSIGHNHSPRFVKPQLVVAERDGQEFFWEMVKGHNSVHILVDNTTTKELLLVKQVRVPVLVNNPDGDGVVFEMCAGLVDKDLDIVDIAREEILEELGYDITSDKIQFIKTLKSGVGSSGSDAHSFYAQVTEDDRVSDGGGLELEDIIVVRMPYDQVYNWMYDTHDHNTDAMTMFLMTYWLYHRANPSL